MAIIISLDDQFSTETLKKKKNIAECCECFWQWQFDEKDIEDLNCPFCNSPCVDVLS